MISQSPGTFDGEEVLSNDEAKISMPEGTKPRTSETQRALTRQWVSILILPVSLVLCARLPADEFPSTIRPVLVRNCQECHDPEGDNRIKFLTAQEHGDVSSERSLWRSVAMQLRNRTMPPATSPQPSEEERFHVASWIDQTLRETACDLGPYAGPVTLRRLNRAEYENTVRDLFGLYFQIAERFPVDGSGGEGFDNNGETLFLSPMLAERYLEVAQDILDQVIITPPLERTFTARDLLPRREMDELNSIEMLPGDSVSRTISVYEDGDYRVSVTIRSPGVADEPHVDVLADGVKAGELVIPWSAANASSRATVIHLPRGVHELSLVVPESDLTIRLVTLDVTQIQAEASPATLAAHFRLFGRESGVAPLQPRKAAQRFLERFLAKAFRRPVEAGEVDHFLQLFDISAKRRDPYEEAIKFMLKAVLTSPDFLYRVETAPRESGAHAISEFELASRLSYFLWGTMPDAELMHLANEGRLQRDSVLATQVDRLLDHPRSRFFSSTFIGQWLGTKDVGGRVAPTLNEIQHFYTPAIAADMRQEPVLVFQRMLNEDRSLLEFINADYTYLTERLAQHYGMADTVQGNEFQLVPITDGRRGGLLGLGAVHAMNAGYKRTSPVLRGVWVHETLLGTKIPSPPPDIPSLETEDRTEAGMTVREMLAEHRAKPACAACHDVIDPIGFGLENYDWLGRWRHSEDGRPVDASGTLTSGETFDGPSELRQVLMGKKDQLLRQVTRKLMGYALGRSLLEQDECVIQQIVTKLEDSNYGARSLVREVVLSHPFRYTEGEAASGDSQ